MSETLWSGSHLAVRRRDGWEYAERPNASGVVAVLAVDDGYVLLIEQHRPPLGCRCLELPAGLVDDDETAEQAAARELEEETGWRAGRLERIGEFASSSGLTSERVTLVRATELSKVDEGGGVGGEDIAVHRVPLDGLAGFVADRRAAGVAVDVKLAMVPGVVD